MMVSGPSWSVPDPDQLPVIRLYGRAGCHLCDEARKVLARLARSYPFQLEEVDATAPGVPVEWLLQVPVIAWGDEVLSSLLVDADLLERKIRKRLPTRGTHAGEA